MKLDWMTTMSPDPYAIPLEPDVLDTILRDDKADTAPFSRQVLSYLEDADFGLLDLNAYCDGYESFKTAATRIAEAFGTLMVQNDAGDTVVEVWDRNIGRIEDGVRYHQTRQGGDIHTDSVNRPDPMKLLILGSATTALIGGETIIIRAREVCERLAAFPEVEDILRQPFFFEGRGMSEEIELFQLPVLAGSVDKPDFRYLRSYIASAHERAGWPLTTDQIFAFDVLDAFNEMSDLQHRFTLQQGQLLLAFDTRVFHGRTSFVDGVTPDAWSKGRRMLRYWVE